MDQGLLVKQIFDEYGWDYSEYTWLSELVPYYLIEPLYEAERNYTRLGGLHVKSWERFGNSVVQLSNIAAICEKFHIPAIYFEEDHPIFDVGRLAKTTGTPFIKRRRRDFALADGVVLSGIFFFDTPFNLFAGTRRQEVMDEHVSRLLPEEFSDGHSLVDSQTITVHFRAGDVFSIPVVGTAALWGQPPLAYYKLVLDQSSAERVVIIYEDMGNPVVQSFSDYARSVGRKVVLQSADLHSDLAVLFNSTELVGGFGSFLWAVFTLSKSLRKFWFFERIIDQTPFARTHLTIGRVHDHAGGYVQAAMNANWASTPEQLRLMIDYPMSALAITKPEATEPSSFSDRAYVRRLLLSIFPERVTTTVPS